MENYFYLNLLICRTKISTLMLRMPSSCQVGVSLDHSYRLGSYEPSRSTKAVHEC